MYDDFASDPDRIQNIIIYSAEQNSSAKIMLNSLREWGERRSTRVFALKIAQKRLEFEGGCNQPVTAQAGSPPGFNRPGQCPPQGGEYISRAVT